MQTIRLTALALLSAVLLPAAAWAEARHFDMTIEEVTIDVAPGLKYKVWAYNGQVPGPLLHVRHGMYQTNRWRSDGVPDITQKAIEPGQSFTYRFVANKVGTLWYPCHVNVPEHVGLRAMWGPFIIDPKEPIPIEKEVTKEAILMFSGWNPEVAQEYGKGGHPGEPITYFSINGKSFPTTQPLRVKKGDVLRLRHARCGLPPPWSRHAGHA